MPTKRLVLRLTEIKYAGDNIGAELTFEITAYGSKTGVRKRMKHDSVAAFDETVLMKEVAGNATTINVTVAITEKDKISDTGQGASRLTVSMDKLPQSSTVSVTVQGKGGDKKKKGQFALTFQARLAGAAEITKADLCNDIIETVLSPQSDSGKFTLDLIGPKKTVTLVKSVNRSGGTYTDHFNLKKLPDNTDFTKLRATWASGGRTNSSEKSAKFSVLGNFLITCYNTPDESEAFLQDGNKVKIAVTAGPPKGEFTIIEVAEKFWKRLKKNGSGRLADGRLVKIEFFLKPPPGYKGKWFRTSTDIRGSCNVVLEPNMSVAADPKLLRCDDQLCIQDLPGMKIVHDRGSAVTGNHLDLYHGVGDTEQCLNQTYKNKKVVKLK